jgi:FAD/FMN-containing dehydrogenase
VLTAVMLRLVPPAASRSTALLAVDGIGAAVAALVRLRALLPELDAAEFFTETGLRLVLAHTSGAHPFDAAHPVYLLVEVAAPGEAGEPGGRPGPGLTDRLTDRLTGALGALDGLRDAVVAQFPADRRRLWELREGHTEAVNAAGVPVKLDVAVPLDRLDGFVRELAQVLAAVAPSAEPVLFGHLAEGNVHVNVLGAEHADEQGGVTDAVLRLVAGAGGSISAEHGIGRAKRRWLGLTRGPADVAAMRAVKAALDPRGLLSPGRVLPD